MRPFFRHLLLVLLALSLGFQSTVWAMAARCCDHNSGQAAVSTMPAHPDHMMSDASMHDMAAMAGHNDSGLDHAKAPGSICNCTGASCAGVSVASATIPQHAGFFVATSGWDVVDLPAAPSDAYARGLIRPPSRS